MTAPRTSRGEPICPLGDDSPDAAPRAASSSSSFAGKEECVSSRRAGAGSGDVPLPEAIPASPRGRLDGRRGKRSSSSDPMQIAAAQCFPSIAFDSNRSLHVGHCHRACSPSISSSDEDMIVDTSSADVKMRRANTRRCRFSSKRCRRSAFAGRVAPNWDDFSCMRRRVSTHQ